MSLAENLDDLIRHRNDFDTRRGFAYSVLDDSGEVIGCVYIYPSDKPGADARVHSWVRSSCEHMDQSLWKTVSGWLGVGRTYGVLGQPIVMLAVGV